MKKTDTAATETRADGFGWDDKIDPKQPPQVLLPKGAAVFDVLDLKRERKAFGSFGVQNVAVLTLMVKSFVEPGEGEESDAEVPVQLALVSKLKWKIVQFFTAIGQRKSGDEGEFAPDWSKVKGTGGCCLVEHRPYTKKDGTSTEVNEIAKFLAPDEAVPESPADPKF